MAIITPPPAPNDIRRRQLVNKLFQQYRTNSPGRASAPGGGTPFRGGGVAPAFLHTSVTQGHNVGQNIRGELGPGGFGLPTGRESSASFGGEIAPPHGNTVDMPLPSPVALPLPGAGVGAGGLTGPIDPGLAGHTFNPAGPNPAQPINQPAPSINPSVPNQPSSGGFVAPSAGAGVTSKFGNAGQFLNAGDGSIPPTAVAIGGGNFFDPVSGSFINPATVSGSLGGSASLLGRAGTTNRGQ